MAPLRSKLALTPIFGRIRFRLLFAHFSSNLNKLGVENDLLVETNLMMKRAKLYLLKYRICHFVPSCATWVTMSIRAPNHVLKVDLGHDYNPQPLT